MTEYEVHEAQVKYSRSRLFYHAARVGPRVFLLDFGTSKDISYGIL